NPLFAVAVRAFISKLQLVLTLFEHIRDQYLQQLCMTAMSTLDAGLSVKFQTGRTQFLVCATDRFFVIIRESEDDGAPFFKELAINAVEVCFQLNTLPMTQAGPAGCVAVTA